MPLAPFQLERYFALYEFKVKYLLSPSECESLSMSVLIQMAAPASLELWQELRLSYTESQGHPLLRDEIAKIYQHDPPGTIIIAAPEEAIFVTMQTLLKPGDQVMAISPAYQSLHEIARSIGCEVSKWSLEPAADGNWQLDLDELEERLTGRTRMLVINFPHNPTGYTISRTELDSIIALARKHDLYLFSDEMYRLLEYTSAMCLPAVCDLYEKGISLSGLSKSFALPGVRIGWLATQESALVQAWLTYKDYTTICNSAPGEILGIIALQNKERIVRRNLAIIRENIASAEAFFGRHSQYFAWFGPKAGSVAFSEWLGLGPVEQFCQAVLDKQGVMIVPGSLFGFHGNHFRVGLGRRNLPEALAHIGEYLKEC